MRQIIQDLRPTTLDYGLPSAINELADGLSNRQGSGLAVQVNIPSTDARFDSSVELHVFRIIEQASENALRHSQTGLSLPRARELVAGGAGARVRFEG